MANKDVIKSAVTEATASELYDATEIEFKDLKIIAKQLIDRVNEISDLGVSIRRYSLLSEQIQAFYTMMHNSVEFTREVLDLQHQFESRLDKFLNRTIYLTYVNKDGTLSFYDEAQTGGLYQKATRGKGSGKLSKGKMFESHVLEKELEEKVNIASMKKVKIYKEAIKRWESNENEKTRKKYPNSRHTFYWRLHSPTHITDWTDPIPNRGFIAEGYVNAVINDTSNKVINENLEYSLQNLWTDFIYVGNVPGIVKGDIIMKSNNSIQFAVKSGSFSTAKFGPVLILAYNILQIEDISVDDFIKALPDLVRMSPLTEEINNIAMLKGENEIKNQIHSKEHSYKIQVSVG